MATPGTIYTIFNQRIHVAPLGTKLPKLTLPKGGNWADATLGDPAWKRIPHTEEGAVVTPTAPKDDINSDEAGGSIGVVPAGGSEITIGFTPITPDLELFSWLASFNLEEVAAVTTVGSERPAYKRASLTPAGRQFMVGIEGQLDAGGLTANGGFVRAFGYRVEQTEETEINMRSTGEDAVLRVGAAVRCLVTEVTTVQKNGIPTTDSRFDMFFVENAAA